MMADLGTQTRSFRPPQDNVPKTKKEREALLEAVGRYVEEHKPVPPLSLGELRRHAGEVIRSTGADDKYTDFAAVLVSNAAWWPVVAGIPYHKRLLLLPKCLRNKDLCPAEFDEIGLLCEHCGNCLNDELKRQAEQLGYAVLIAEGSPIVMSLVKTGKVDAIIGVSCLSVLENVFPYMDAGAVPGIAIPLLYDGCCNTGVDVDWVWEVIYRTAEKEARRLNLEALRSEVETWFNQDAVGRLIGGELSEVEKLGADWLAGEGKRWRPFLTAAVYEALTADGSKLPQALQQAAVAVECFHKASLIHDDIEDGDDLRYGRKTVHAQCGVPIALNVGDYLLGEGYRLLAELALPDACRARCVQVAAQGHRSLCLGQGKELAWVRRPQPLSVDEVIDIFRKKTSPAFEVALKLGAIVAGRDAELAEVLETYSEALGIAYQIRDDLEEFETGDGLRHVKAMKPSLLLAMALEKAEGPQKELLKSVWDCSVEIEGVYADVLRIFDECAVPRAAFNLMELYKSRALSCLGQLTSGDLKALLRRVISKIFNEIDLMGCCNDYQARHAGRRRPGETPAE
ncbi:MAG: polyprenyl synthetase family protein [Phycisphaerae bacterium]|nr:polyprenyl synthetase family protein [Phycisphaerae bacterium]